MPIPAAGSSLGARGAPAVLKRLRPERLTDAARLALMRAGIEAERRAARARKASCIPRSQSPRGSVMTPARCEEARRLAAEGLGAMAAARRLGVGFPALYSWSKGPNGVCFQDRKGQGGGPPTLFTPEVVEAIRRLASREGGASIREAAAATGLRYDAVRKARAQGRLPGIEFRAEATRERRADYARAALAKRREKAPPPLTREERLAARRIRSKAPEIDRDDVMRAVGRLDHIRPRAAR